IVEAGYLSNSADRQLLQTDSYQNAVADGIYQGILKYAPEIEQLKPRLEAAKVAHPQAAPIPAAAARQATSRGAGWLGPVLVSGGLGFALLATVRRAHARRRRRTRRIPSYGVVRVR
ncbi:MAG TPA: N-acetylmuramoyl-L-alanine amidase, partial [Chloroflexota bacterium]